MSRTSVVIAFAAAATAMSVVADAALDTRPTPIGHWYTEYEPERGAWYGYMLWDFHPDGTIQIRARICSKARKGVADVANSGTWDYSGDTFTFAWTGHGKVFTGCRRYRVADTDRDRWTVQSFCTHNTYAMVRVTATSELPGCDMTS